MKLLIKFPTRNRKNKFFNTLKKYQHFLSNTQVVEFLISLDSDDDSMNDPLTEEILLQYDNLKFFFGQSKSKVDAVNRDIEKIESWDIILLASDDMIPQVKGFDDIIIRKMQELYPDTDGVLFFNDGFKKDELNTLCILGKKYYDRFKYIYNPDYKSVYCDNEFTMVANLLGRQTYIDQVLIKHEHPDWGYGKHDGIHQKNFQDLSHDRNLFHKRMQSNFNL